MKHKNKSIHSEKFIFPRTGHVLKNRTVLAAMTNKQSYSDGTLSEVELKWLLRRAKGGFGIITTAAAHVSKEGQGWDGEIGIFSDSHISNLKKLTSEVKKTGSLIFLQLFHGGMRSPQKITGKKPISSSKNKTQESYDGMTKSASKKEINQIIKDFSDAAERCVKAGFDGVELHGAHGYLLSQFLGNKTNRRSDEWGGTIQGRSKIIIDIFKAIKKNVPDSFIVGIRISPEIKDIGITLRDSFSLIKSLSQNRIDFIHVSCWDIYARSIEFQENPNTLTEWIIKNIKDLPTIITTGNIWSSIDALNSLKQGADLFGVAKVAIAYPDWANKISLKNYNPPKGPFTALQLQKVDLGDVFIDYMRLWKGFIKNES